MKRNAERYMFSEPRAPVDAVRARIRESRFSFRQAEAVVNFFAICINEWLFGPEIPFLPKILLLGPKTDFGPRNALFRPKTLFGQKGLHFHQFSIGFISIRGMGAQKCTFSQKTPFRPQSRKKSENTQFGMNKCNFGPKFAFLAPVAPFFQIGWGYVSS